jgi:Nicotinic acid phosphoribosyltransferase
LDEQGAKIDGFGIGTELVTGKPDSALDGVYKLAECNGIPRMKISENIEKLTLPGKKKLYRFYDEEDKFYRDGILLDNETPESCGYIVNPAFPEKKRLHWGTKKRGVAETGFRQWQYSGRGAQSNGNSSISASPCRTNCPTKHKRFIMPHIYKVGISPGVLELRNQLIAKYDKK